MKPQDRPNTSTLILVLDESARRIQGAAIVPSDCAIDCLEYIQAKLESASPSAPLESLISQAVLGRFLARITHTIAVRVRPPR